MAPVLTPPFSVSGGLGGPGKQPPLSYPSSDKPRSQAGDGTRILSWPGGCDRVVPRIESPLPPPSAAGSPLLRSEPSIALQTHSPGENE